MTTPTSTQPESRTAEERPRIYSHMTKSRFLHVEDSLKIGKIRLFIGEYKKGEGMSKNAYHFIDVEDARVLFSDLSWGKAVKFTDYKGGKNGGGEITSRVMTANTKDDKVWIEIKNGPGKESETGAVMPAGEPTAAVSISLTIPEARRLAHTVLAHIAAQVAARAVWEMYEARNPDRGRSKTHQD